MKDILKISESVNNLLDDVEALLESSERELEGFEESEKYTQRHRDLGEKVDSLAEIFNSLQEARDVILNMQE